MSEPDSKAAPRLTIGLPVYNGENYLTQAIDAILSQSFTDFELVISDNASEDGTAEICRDYCRRDSRVIYHRQERNLGAAGNYNGLVARARGEFFKWATHDDYILPGYLEKCVAALDSHPDVILSYPRTVLFDEEADTRVEFDERLHLTQDQPHERFNRLIVDIRLCSAVVGVIRTDVLRKTRLIDKFSGSDFVLLVELCLLGKFFEVPEYLYCRREHAGRSLRRNVKTADVDKWFDSLSKGSTRFPQVRLFREQLKSVSRMPLSPGQRARCYAQVLRWVLKRWQVSGGRYKAIAQAKLGARPAGV